MPNPTFPILYSRTVRGQTQTWQIEVSGHRFRTTEGLDGGVLTTSSWTVCKAKNVGRANATTASEQAAKEAAARHQKKLDKGYREDKTAIGEAAFFKPMLAQSYDDYVDDIQYPVWVQPKLDGVRCIATKDGLCTRNGKPIVSVPHVRAALVSLFAAHPTLILDGELYASDLDDGFNQIVSLVKKTKPTAADLEASTAVQYWVYDSYVPEQPDACLGARSGPFHGHFDTIHNGLPSELGYVHTYDARGLSELDDRYQAFLDLGFEGMMIRDMNARYENKRTKSLLKRKPMIDGEFLLTDIQPGRGGAAHHAARALLKTEVGDPFEVGIIGDHAYAADLLKHKDLYIGTMCTVTYQNLTPGANPVPRFGKLKEINRTDA